MPINKVLITFKDWEREFQDAAAAHGFSGTIICSDDEAEMLREIADADAVVIGSFNAELLAAAGNLQLVHACSGGVNGLLFPELVASDVPMVCLKPAFGTVGGEHAIAAMLGVARKFDYTPVSLPMTQWDDGYDAVAKPFDLEGSTVGIVGLGTMGTAVAQRARALGMRVLGLTRTQRTAEAADATYTADQRAAFLGQCDFVVIAVPVTPATEGMIDAAFLGEMKSSAYLIDCSGRSVLFDYPALVEAITGQTIAGASLQPSGASAELRCPPAGDPFWERPNVIVTPCRGTSVQTNDKARNLIFDNFRRLDSGEPLLGLVDKAAGY